MAPAYLFRLMMDEIKTNVVKVLTPHFKYAMIRLRKIKQRQIVCRQAMAYLRILSTRNLSTGI